MSDALFGARAGEDVCGIYGAVGRLPSAGAPVAEKDFVLVLDFLPLDYN